MAWLWNAVIYLWVSWSFFHHKAHFDFWTTFDELTTFFSIEIMYLKFLSGVYSRLWNQFLILSNLRLGLNPLMFSYPKLIRHFKSGIWCIKYRRYHFRYFKGCLPQILLGPFLYTLTRIKMFAEFPKSSNPFGILYFSKHLVRIYCRVVVLLHINWTSNNVVVRLRVV